MNDSCWNLEVVNQTLKDQIQELESHFSKSNSLLKESEKSKSNLLFSLEISKNKELELMHDIETQRVCIERLKTQLRNNSSVKVGVNNPSFDNDTNLNLNSTGSMDNHSILSKDSTECDVLTQDESDQMEENSTMNAKMAFYENEIQRLEHQIQEFKTKESICVTSETTQTCAEILFVDSNHILLSNLLEKKENVKLMKNSQIQVPSFASNDSESNSWFHFTLKYTLFNESNESKDVNYQDKTTMVDENEFILEDPITMINSQIGDHSFNWGSDTSKRDRLLSLDTTPNPIEALTYTMIGTWVSLLRLHKNSKF